MKVSDQLMYTLGGFSRCLATRFPYQIKQQSIRIGYVCRDGELEHRQRQCSDA